MPGEYGPHEGAEQFTAEAESSNLNGDSSSERNKKPEDNRESEKSAPKVKESLLSKIFGSREKKSEPEYDLGSPLNLTRATADSHHLGIQYEPTQHWTEAGAPDSRIEQREAEPVPEVREMVDQTIEQAEAADLAAAESPAAKKSHGARIRAGLEKVREALPDLDGARATWGRVRAGAGGIAKKTGVKEVFHVELNDWFGSNKENIKDALRSAAIGATAGGIKSTALKVAVGYKLKKALAIKTAGASVLVAGGLAGGWEALREYGRTKRNEKAFHELLGMGRDQQKEYLKNLRSKKPKELREEANLKDLANLETLINTEWESGRGMDRLRKVIAARSKAERKALTPDESILQQHLKRTGALNVNKKKILAGAIIAASTSFVLSEIAEAYMLADSSHVHDAVHSMHELGAQHGAAGHAIAGHGPEAGHPTPTPTPEAHATPTPTPEAHATPSPTPEATPVSSHHMIADGQHPAGHPEVQAAAAAAEVEGKDFLPMHKDVSHTVEHYLHEQLKAKGISTTPAHFKAMVREGWMRLANANQIDIAQHHAAGLHKGGGSGLYQHFDKHIDTHLEEGFKLHHLDVLDNMLKEHTQHVAGSAVKAGVELKTQIAAEHAGAAASTAHSAVENASNIAKSAAESTPHPTPTVTPTPTPTPEVHATPSPTPEHLPTPKATLSPEHLAKAAQEQKGWFSRIAMPAILFGSGAAIGAGVAEVRRAKKERGADRPNPNLDRESGEAPQSQSVDSAEIPVNAAEAPTVDTIQHLSEPEIISPSSAARKAARPSAPAPSRRSTIDAESIRPARLEANNPAPEAAAEPQATAEPQAAPQPDIAARSEAASESELQPEQSQAAAQDETPPASNPRRSPDAENPMAIVDAQLEQHPDVDKDEYKKLMVSTRAKTGLINAAIESGAITGAVGREIMNAIRQQIEGDNSGFRRILEIFMGQQENEALKKIIVSLRKLKGGAWTKTIKAFDRDGKKKDPQEYVPDWIKLTGRR